MFKTLIATLCLMTSAAWAQEDGAPAEPLTLTVDSTRYACEPAGDDDPGDPDGPELCICDGWAYPIHCNYPQSFQDCCERFCMMLDAYWKGIDSPL